ncbi:hypothetical protein D3C75_725140 [compost metagenome]
MVGDELEQRTHGDHGEDERGHEADGEHRQVAGLEQLTVLVTRIHCCADHGRHRQKERELGGRLARQAEQQAADDGGPGTRRARDHCQALDEADLQGMAPAHVIDVVDCHAVGTAFGPEHDYPANHQGRCHGDRVEQVVVNQVGEQHAQHHRWQERQQQVAGEASRRGLAGQAEHHFQDLAAKLPHYRQDRRQLDDDVERYRAFTAEIYQIGNDDLVSGTGDR